VVTKFYTEVRRGIWDHSFLLPIIPADGRLRSGDTNRLMVPSVRRSTVGDRAFTVAGPRVWNTLPEEITTSQPSVNNLKPGSSENHIRTLIIF